jgi:hypothetical protein
MLIEKMLGTFHGGKSQPAVLTKEIPVAGFLSKSFMHLCQADRLKGFCHLVCSIVPSEALLKMAVLLKR